MKVRDKVIVVTGGGSGMGRELVLNILSKGAKVVAIDMNEGALQETVALAGDNKEFLAAYILDITKKESVEQCVDKIISLHDHVDGIINNAGIIQPFIKVADLGYEAIERVMNVNFYGTLYITKTFLPHLLTRPEAHIVNMSSMGGFLLMPGQIIYGASKAAVKLFTEGLHSELANTKVRITIVFPGAVNTNITKNSGLKASAKPDSEDRSMKILSATKAAQIIINGMENNSYRVLVGKDATFLDLIYRLNPRRAAKFINNKMLSLRAH